MRFRFRFIEVLGYIELADERREVAVLEKLRDNFGFKGCSVPNQHLCVCECECVCVCVCVCMGVFVLFFIFVTKSKGCCVCRNSA